MRRPVGVKGIRFGSCWSPLLILASPRRIALVPILGHGIPSPWANTELSRTVAECFGFRIWIIANWRCSTASAHPPRDAFTRKLRKTAPSVSQVWRRNWARITPFFNYPPDIRKAIYTTNSVESLNRSLRKIIKTRGGFPNQDAALKLLFLALRQAAKKWTMPIHHWREALNHFTILWPERMPALERVTQ